MAVQRKLQWFYNLKITGSVAVIPMMRWITVGPRKEPENSLHNKKFDRLVPILAKLIMNIMVTDRQVQYSSKRAKNGTYKNVNESPLKFVCDFASTRLHKTRPWLINDQVSAYVHLLIKLKNRNCKAKPTCCWCEVWTQRCLCTTQYHQRETLHFAIENIVFENDTSGGKNEFHQTAQMILQKRMESTR